MPLTRASALFYWSSRFGPLPIIGGHPTHSRNSAGATLDARGGGYSAIINTPRFDWATDRATTANERRAFLLLEAARSNQLGFSVDFSNAAWGAKTNLVLTGGIDDPFGGTSAYRIASNAAGILQQQLANSTTIVRTNALWARRRSGSGGFGFYDPNQVTRVNPVLSSQWQRFQNVGAAAFQRFMDIRFDSGGDVIDLYNAQMEDGAGATGDMVTTSSAATSRAADTLSWPFPFLIQGMVLYERYIYSQGAGFTGTPRHWAIEGPANGTPRLTVYDSAGINALFHNGTSSATSTASVTPATGDTVETIAVLTGAGVLTLAVSVNGAAVVSGGATGALTLPASAFAGGALFLNSGNGSDVGLTRHGELRAVRFADVAASTMQGIMDELRAYEIGPNGDLL
jgi:hypothetical protein